jgi:hypothetical protein
MTLRELRIRRVGGEARLFVISRFGQVERWLSAPIDSVDALRSLASTVAGLSSNAVWVEDFCLSQPDDHQEVFAALLDAYRPDLPAPSDSTEPHPA